MILQAPELRFAEKFCTLLREYGSARLEYVTAEFQPFSNQQRPDVAFLPGSGGFKGQLVFFEIKFAPTTWRSQNLAEHRKLALETLDCPIGKYIFVTPHRVADFTKKLLLAKQILTYDSVSDEEDVLLRMGRAGIIRSA